MSRLKKISLEYECQYSYPRARSVEERCIPVEFNIPNIDILLRPSSLETYEEHAVSEQITAPEQLPALYQRLLRDMARKRLPKRRLRSNPRVVKRKMSNFKLKRAEHLAWPQPTHRSFRETIEINMFQELPSPIIMCLPSQPDVFPVSVLI